MRPLLIVLALISAAWVNPTASISNLKKDPCLQTIEQAVLTIQVSSPKELALASVELLSAKEDRSYLMKFDGLVGSYRLILDNDPNNRCFFVRQSFEF